MQHTGAKRVRPDGQSYNQECLRQSRSLPRVESWPVELGRPRRLCSALSDPRCCLPFQIRSVSASSPLRFFLSPPRRPPPRNIPPPDPPTSPTPSVSAKPSKAAPNSSAPASSTTASSKPTVPSTTAIPPRPKPMPPSPPSPTSSLKRAASFRIRRPSATPSANMNFSAINIPRAATASARFSQKPKSISGTWPTWTRPRRPIKIFCASIRRTRSAQKPEPNSRTSVATKSQKPATNHRPDPLVRRHTKTPQHRNHRRRDPFQRQPTQQGINRHPPPAPRSKKAASRTSNLQKTRRSHLQRLSRPASQRTPAR
jgi:hypothetical protein